MSVWEVAAENGHRVRVRAASDEDAVMMAGEIDPDIWYAGAYLADDLPVGWDGGDPHTPDDLTESLDNGDYV